MPAYDPTDVQKVLQMISAECHHEALYGKLSLYNASLLKKCLRLYKKTAMVVQDERVGPVEHLANMTELPEFDTIFKRDFSDPSFEGAQEDFHAHLTKMAILNHLFSREFELYTNMGQSDTVMA